MARLTFWGDYKVDSVDRLSLSGDLTYLLNMSDANVINFEAPLQSNAYAIRKSGPNIWQDKDAPMWLERYGFNIISLANNHTMDLGLEGMNATKVAFKKARVLGCGLWKEAYQLEVIETKDGLKIGFLSCTHCEFGTLTDASCKEKQGTAWACAPEFERTIQMKEKHYCDFLIVIAHCGVEYMEQPLPEWRDKYKRWIELGADAVIASHPHVPQGWEMYKGKPICYSLGNFCFDKLDKKKAPQNWYNSLCCVLDVDKQNGINMTIKPIVFDPSMRYISENPSDTFCEYLKRVNSILENDREYMAYVDHFVASMLPHYMNQFSRGGLVHNCFSIGFIKGVAEGLMGRGFFKKEHWINNLQCESHRWAILRAMNNKD